MVHYNSVIMPNAKSRLEGNKVEQWNCVLWSDDTRLE